MYRLGIPVSGQIHEKSTSELANVVCQIVDVEGPVHISEVVRRIRVAWGLKRAGKRIQDAITEGMVQAQENGDVTVKDEFLVTATPRYRQKASATGKAC